MIPALVNRDSLPFFNALASETRLRMIELLAERQLNIRELAAALGLSSSIIARHVQMLEDAGIIVCNTLPGERGLQKRCKLVHDGFALNFGQVHAYSDVNVFEVPVGDYFSWSVKPTCGLATQQSYIGSQDDVRCFADPRRTEAGLIWLGSGYLEYIIPNYADVRSTPNELRIQLEICSEAPGWDMAWPSDIYFYINDHPLGFWTAPGDFGDKPGLHSPDWYRRSRNTSQYGSLKQVTVNRSGTYIDGLPMSGVRIGDLNLNQSQFIHFKIACPEDAANPRGFNLYGKGFGNYDQGIILSIVSDPADKPTFQSNDAPVGKNAGGQI